MQKSKTNLGSTLIIISALFYSTYGVWSKLMQAPYFFGFEHLSVGTATLLFYCFLTLGAYLIGALFFKEKMTLPKILGLIIASIGLYNIYAFSLESNQVVAAIATSIAGLMGACAVVFSKKVSDRYSELQIIVVYGVFILIGNLAMTLSLGETMPKLILNTGWLAQLGYATSFLLANAAVVAGFRHIEPSVGGVLGLLEVVFAAILGVIIFSESVTLGLLIGGVLIVVGALIPTITKCGFYKQFASYFEQPTRKFFWSGYFRRRKHNFSFCV
ncbi:MAG: hypothetical protein COY80_01965 [Candidatus Pacebacteria bacterium CG_4_10_14_0_8_um_filter_42_14]|nr:MAG: hypothetical protein COY80_01965 [Candidatus Pacebacteria bacterium CG_4_10_14_0_8_um_filter_42_14]